MFTGIVKGLFEVTAVQKSSGLTKFRVGLPAAFLDDLKIGASVSIDGVCQTAVKIEGNSVWFDAIQETLDRTTLNSLSVGRRVNVERSAKIGDEIGGHLLSGHIYGKAQISKIELWENNCKMTFSCDPVWMKYLFSKGYIAIDGASLTLVDVNPTGFFSVHLIPETLRMTTLGVKKESDFVNIEFDSQTQAIVETVERVLQATSLSRPSN